MNKKIIKITLLLLVTILLTGCFKLGNKPKNNTNNTNNTTTTEVKTSVSKDEMETMDKISNLVFNVEKEELKNENLTDEEKSSIARELIDDYRYMEVSGTEMTKNFQKYFGLKQTINFQDIKCFIDHGNEEENIMIRFNKEKDKYEYNENHPGHGGGGSVEVSKKIGYDEVECTNKKCTYKAKVLFYGPVTCHDIGPCEYGKGYKTYKDAKNQTNPIIELNNNKKYIEEINGFPNVKMDEVFEDVRKELDTYIFVFEKENDNLIFNNYKKA